jgi:CheY-like chemotaxis protein
MSLVLAFVDDLMFLSRIREAARGAGLGVRTVRTAADLLGGARDGARLVLVDADSGRLPWADAVRALRADATTPRLPVVAFLSHVHAEHAEEARAAGCSRVLARSAFVRELPGIMTAARDVQEEKTP